jgi:hypothetical protein
VIFGDALVLPAEVFILTGLIDFLPDFGEELLLGVPYKLFLFAISVGDAASLLFIIRPEY